jgi:serine/threonine protein kinase
MDALMEEEYEEEEPTKEARWSSWLFQVIAGLVVAQHYYGFVHNDLHTNNVMWSETSEPYLYYRVHKKDATVSYMKVPTFGKLMKIIDFGRASFTLPPENGGFYISDAFFQGNDAADQYNCAPFYDASNGPKLEPNYSFDLCRLSVSLIESLYPTRPESVHPVRPLSREGSKIYTETVSPLYNLLWKWLIDKSGKNVLRSPDGYERYPDFDLYKAIGRDVRGAVPTAQLNAAAFASFQIVDAPPTDCKIYDLHC